MNHVQLIGVLVGAPRSVELINGTKAARFNMVTREYVLSEKGETQEQKTWHKLIAWGRPKRELDQVKELGIGIAIEGKLVSRFCRSAGATFTYHEIEVNSLEII